MLEYVLLITGSGETAPGNGFYDAEALAVVLSLEAGLELSVVLVLFVSVALSLLLVSLLVDEDEPLLR